MGLNATFDDDPEGYERLRRCWLNTRREMFISWWLRQLRLADGASVMEIGSGTGWLLRNLSREFPSFRFVGLEPIGEYVDFATARNSSSNLRFVRGTAKEARQCVRGSFEAFLSNDVLHHVESIEGTVRSVSAIAAPGCRWLAIEPNPLNPYVFCNQAFKTGERNFAPRTFLRTCGTHRWKPLDRRYLFAIPPFVKEAPQWMKSWERRMEGYALIGGGICLDLSFPKGTA